MIAHCLSVRSMPVRYDGARLTVYEIASRQGVVRVRPAWHGVYADPPSRARGLLPAFACPTAYRIA